MCAKDLGQLIRDLEARRAERSARRGARGVLHSPALRGIEAVERVELHVLGYLDALREAFPRLRQRRRLFDGAWQVGVFELPPPGRGADREATYSRLVFDLRADPLERHRVRVDCRATAHDRDLPAARLALNAAHDLGDLEQFLEDACTAFAAAYLRRAPAR